MDEAPSRRSSRRRALDLCAALAELYFGARREYDIDLTHRAIRVLQLVAYRESPPRIDDVARFLGCATSTASELVKRLQTKGLVARKRSESDERVVHLWMTQAGHEALVQHTSLDPDKVHPGLASLSAADQELLVRLVRAVSARVPRDPRTGTPAPEDASRGVG